MHALHSAASSGAGVFQPERALTHSLATSSSRLVMSRPQHQRQRASHVKLNVMTPARSELQSAQKGAFVAPTLLSPNEIINEVVAPVKADMDQMNTNLRNVVGNRHPMLLAAAEQIFGAGGKKLRPMLVFLVSRATAHAMSIG